MSERDIGPPGLRLSERRPRFLLSRHHAATIVVLGYLCLVLCARLFLGYVESTQGYDDARDIHATLLFAAVMMVFCIRALVNIYRPVKLPSPW